MDARALLVVLALVAGIAIGAVGTSPTLFGHADAAPRLGQDPPSSWSAGTSGNLSRADDPAAGWLHELHLDDRIVFTGNATVVHAADREVDVAVEAMGTRDYVLRIGTRPARESKGGGPQVSSVEFGTTLPKDFGTLEVWANGEHVLTVENDGTTNPKLFDLPSPIDTTG